MQKRWGVVEEASSTTPSPNVLRKLETSRHFRVKNPRRKATNNDNKSNNNENNIHNLY